MSIYSLLILLVIFWSTVLVDKCYGVGRWLAPVVVIGANFIGFLTLRTFGYSSFTDRSTLIVSVCILAALLIRNRYRARKILNP